MYYHQLIPLAAGSLILSLSDELGRMVAGLVILEPLIYDFTSKAKDFINSIYYIFLKMKCSQ